MATGYSRSDHFQRLADALSSKQLPVTLVVGGANLSSGAYLSVRELPPTLASSGASSRSREHQPRAWGTLAKPSAVGRPRILKFARDSDLSSASFPSSKAGSMLGSFTPLKSRFKWANRLACPLQPLIIVDTHRSIQHQENIPIRRMEHLHHTECWIITLSAG